MAPNQWKWLMYVWRWRLLTFIHDKSFTGLTTIILALLYLNRSYTEYLECSYCAWNKHGCTLDTSDNVSIDGFRNVRAAFLSTVNMTCVYMQMKVVHIHPPEVLPRINYNYRLAVVCFHPPVKLHFSKWSHWIIGRPWHSTTKSYSVHSVQVVVFCQIQSHFFEAFLRCWMSEN